MYKLLLILRYLRYRRIAWVSLIAVTLCSTLVLVVNGVMGGWVEKFRDAAHGMHGDIRIAGSPVNGFPYYQEIAAKVRALPQVKAVAPVCESFGLLNFENLNQTPVFIIGIDDSVKDVNAYPQTLEFHAQSPAQSIFNPDILKSTFTDDLPPNVSPTTKPIILSSAIFGPVRDFNGNYVSRERYIGRWVELSVLPISPGQSFTATDRVDRFFHVVDDSRPQIYQVDHDQVVIPFDQLQRMLNMDASTATRVDPATGREYTVQIPARIQELQVSTLPGTDLLALSKQIQQIVADVKAGHKSEDPFDLQHGNSTIDHFPVDVQTWQVANAQFLGVVEHEEVLVTFLIGIVSLVCVFLVFCIFYMIVVEKTKDVGIVKSVGATRNGVITIFLGYGIVLGLVGSALGALLAFLIIHNINWIQDKLASAMGVQLWDPQFYQFDSIPNQMKLLPVLIVLAVGIVSCLLGALIPAFYAGSMQPVESLRWE